MSFLMPLLRNVLKLVNLEMCYLRRRFEEHSLIALVTLETVSNVCDTGAF